LVCGGGTFEYDVTPCLPEAAQVCLSVSAQAHDICLHPTSMWVLYKGQHTVGDDSSPWKFPYLLPTFNSSADGARCALTIHYVIRVTQSLKPSGLV
jgi:hypothetical protein